MNTNKILKEINTSGKPYVIYKTLKGFDLFTNYSKKIILNKKNIFHFLNKKNVRKKYKSTDLFIGFFGYELLNNLIGIKISKQKNINFPKGIFYKPEKKISFTKNLSYKKDDNFKQKKNFTININRKSYAKIFNNFKKNIKSGETYQIKICTKYKNKSKLDPLDFFCRLAKSNLAPEAFMIKDKNFSIISCSPENLITKKRFIDINQANSWNFEKNQKNQ
ncbi:chorismate-binding protein [Candidatus Pelagibacter sp.]|nr:chorismate-binding protein [Candidatus Pelagibacter sp.]